ncbi:MAG: shikimate dehydrogenase [Ferroplasma sp.]
MLISGLIGKPVTHSAGQRIYNNFFKANNMPSIYLSIDLDECNIDNFIEFASANMVGFNITAPYKQSMAKYMQSMDEIADNTGSINLVKNDSGKLYGFNSDYSGFLFLLKNNGINLDKKNVIILGTGGAARTVFYAIKKNYGADVKIASRNPQTKKIEDANIIGYDDINAYDVIINCTPLGTCHDTRMAVPESKILDGATGIDLIYNPEKTAFLKAIEKHGGHPVNGLDMFIGQGIETIKRLYNISISYSEFINYLIKK